MLDIMQISNTSNLLKYIESLKVIIATPVLKVNKSNIVENCKTYILLIWKTKINHFFHRNIIENNINEWCLHISNSDLVNIAKYLISESGDAYSS